jgi:hypothetical protein
MTRLFTELNASQVRLLHAVLYREVLDARRGRYVKADAQELRRLYADLDERKREMEEEVG